MDKPTDETVIPTNVDQAPLAEPPATPELSPRVKATQEIVAATQAQHEQDNAAFRANVQEVNEDGEPIAPPAVVEEQPPTDPPAETVAAPTATASEAPAPFDPNLEYDVVVDGHTIKVPGTKIIEMGKRTLQKEAAADLRLQLAERILREAEARAAQAPATGEAPRGPQAPAASAPKAPEAPKGPTPLELAEAIQFGTKEQAAQAIEQLSRQQGAPVTPEQVLSFVQGNLGKMVSGEIEFREAASFVQSEYKDIMSHPYLKQLFFMEENKRRDAGDRSSYKDLYAAIGNDLRKAFNLQPAPAAPAPTTTMAERREQKVATTPPVPRTTAARLEAPAAPKAPTVNQVIDSMRKARHQRPLM